MTRIDFYFDVRDELAFVSRLSRKLYYDGVVTKDHPLLIRCSGLSQISSLSDCLHSYSAKDFLPHALLSEEFATYSPILISDSSNIPNWAKDLVVLINLNTAVDEVFSSFKRVVEIVEIGDESKIRGREKYRFYRDRGYQIFNHRIEK